MIKIALENFSMFHKRYSPTILDISRKVIFEGIAHIGQESKLSVDNEVVLILGKSF